jgi:hypothetical protein
MGPTHVAQEGKHHNANKLPVITHNGRVTTLSYLKKCTRGGKDVLTFYHIHQWVYEIQDVGLT